MSESSPQVFVVPVEGIGALTFRKRTIRLEIACQVEQRRLSEGMEVDGFLAIWIEALSDLKVLMVDPPKGWTAEELHEEDAFDDAAYGRITKVWSAFRDKEAAFRAARTGSQGGGAPGSGDLPPLVPEALQPAGDGPSLP